MIPRLFFLFPYAAVAVGLYAFDSAWTAMLLYHALMLIGLASPARRSAFGRLRGGWSAGAGLWLSAFGLGAGVLLWALSGPAGLTAARLDADLARVGLAGSGFLPFAVYYTLVNPWLEEAFWRGALGSDSRRPTAADFLFAGYHLLVLVLFVEWVWLPVALAVLTAAAWLWRQIVARGGGLAVPAASHLAADASLMVAVAWILGGNAS